MTKEKMKIKEITFKYTLTVDEIKQCLEAHRQNDLFEAEQVQENLIERALDEVAHNYPDLLEAVQE